MLFATCMIPGASQSTRIAGNTPGDSCPAPRALRTSTRLSALVRGDRWMVERPLLFPARRHGGREQSRRHHRRGHLGGHWQLAISHGPADISLDRGMPHTHHPCTRAPAGSALCGAVCLTRAPNAVPAHGSGAGPSADAKERASAPHLPRAGRRDLAAARQHVSARRRGAGSRDGGGARARGGGPDGGILGSCIGAAGTAAATPPEGPGAICVVYRTPLSVHLR